jgi:hypothetical protein
VKDEAGEESVLEEEFTLKEPIESDGLPPEAVSAINKLADSLGQSGTVQSRISVPGGRHFVSLQPDSIRSLLRAVDIIHGIVTIAIRYVVLPAPWSGISTKSAIRSNKTWTKEARIYSKRLRFVLPQRKHSTTLDGQLPCSPAARYLLFCAHLWLSHRR